MDLVMEKNKTELSQRLGLTTAVMLVIGSAIGSGIFRKPATMAAQLGSPQLLVLAWMVAGIITFIGALTNAEIAGIIDETGGQFAYFRVMYGNFTAFIFGWATLAVMQSGSLAAISYVFAEYLEYFFHFPHLSPALEGKVFYLPLIGNLYPLKDIGTKLVAIGCISFLSIVNYFGVVFGGVLQTIVSVIKFLTIFALAVAIFIFGHGSTNNLVTGFASAGSHMNMLAAFGLAIGSAFWAYDGWNNVTYVAGEIKNPKRNVPLALLIGTVAVILVYVLVNIAFLYVLPIGEMAKSPLVAASAAERIMGQIGASLISAAVVISAFGALNGSLLSTSRVLYAMGKSGLFFKSIAHIDSRFKTPSIAILALGLWSNLLVFSGSFDVITDYVIFAEWLFYCLGAYGVFVLRKKMPDAPRPYRVWGYPYVPMVFVLFSGLFLLNTLISATQDAMMGLLFMALGIPFYFLWARDKKRTDH